MVYIYTVVPWRTCSLHACSLMLFYHRMVCPGVPVILNIHYPEHLFPGMFPGAPDLGVPVPRGACPLKCIFSEASAPQWPACWSSLYRHCSLEHLFLFLSPVTYFTSQTACSLECLLPGTCMLPEMFVPWCACSPELSGCSLGAYVPCTAWFLQCKGCSIEWLFRVVAISFSHNGFFLSSFSGVCVPKGVCCGVAVLWSFCPL
jgi:hypothetical protein